MYFSPLSRHCQKVLKNYIKSTDAQNSVKMLCSKVGANKNASEKLETDLPSDRYSTDKSDIFGTLKVPLESYGNNLKYSSVSSKKDKVKIVKIKNRLNFDKHDPNVFGNLSSSDPVWYPDIKEKAKIDNDEDDDSNLVRNISRKYRSPEFYLERMKTLVSEKKLKEALELFIEMKRNFVKPLPPHFTYMIGACGRFGYTDMAFKLLKQLTDRGFTPTPATLTGLFNSCGESPFPDDGLKKAQILKEKIVTKNWQLNQITYHAMIKAFGKCGDLEAAFQIVDEMMKSEIKVDVVTYSFLLMSCIANKETGFTYAIEVWRKMKQRKCKPNLFSFNLLLRAVRDCDVGPEEISCLLLQHWSSYTNRPYGFKTKEDFLPKNEVLKLQGGTVTALDTDESTIVDQIASKHKKIPTNDDLSSNLPDKKKENALIEKRISQVPSVLNARPVSCAELVDLGLIKSASDRLALVGGAEGFLLDMKKAGVKPNVKTFTLLLESLPSSTEAEEHLLSLLDAYTINPDIGFFNMLIKRRNFRLDFAAAHQGLILMNKWSLSPDIITYGVLAIGCKTYRKATIFLNDMRKLGYTPNIETVGALLFNACKIMDFEYIESTLNLMEDQGIEPNERMLKKIETSLELARKNIIDMEHGKDVHPLYKKEGFAREYKNFCIFYESWLKNIGFDKPEHVWDQYKTDIVQKVIKEDVLMPHNFEIAQ